MPKSFQKIIEQVLQSFDLQSRDTQRIKKELESNLLDNKDHLVSQGISPKEAEKRVVNKFGDPAMIGEMLQKHHPTKNIKLIKKLANTIAVTSIIIGLDYALRAKMHEIRYWGILAILGGICAAFATKAINHSKSWQDKAIWGFSFLAIGQIVPILGGVTILNLATNRTGVLSERINEVILGLGMHFLLFTLCLWTIHKILLSRKTPTIE